MLQHLVTSLASPDSTVSSDTVCCCVSGTVDPLWLCKWVSSPGHQGGCSVTLLHRNRSEVGGGRGVGLAGQVGTQRYWRWFPLFHPCFSFYKGNNCVILQHCAGLAVLHRSCWHLNCSIIITDNNVHVVRLQSTVARWFSISRGQFGFLSVFPYQGSSSESSLSLNFKGRHCFLLSLA